MLGKLQRSCHKEHTYGIRITCHSKDMANEKWVKLQGQGHKVKKCGNNKKGFVITNMHIKYESPITCHSKDMSNVKVFEK
jgi:hypothetical protein